MNPEFKHPLFAVGAVLAIIGGVLMLLFLEHQEHGWLLYSGFILWIIGIIILTIYYRRK